MVTLAPNGSTNFSVTITFTESHSTSLFVLIIGECRDSLKKELKRTVWRKREQLITIIKIVIFSWSKIVHTLTNTKNKKIDSKITIKNI